jgi:hypothetical protein
VTNIPPPGGYPGQPPQQPGPYGPPPGQQYAPYGPPQGQFGWGPQFGPPGPPPRKTSNTGLIIGISIIVAAVVGVGLIALALKNNDEKTATPVWTPSATTPAYSPTYEPTNQPTADPTEPTDEPTVPPPTRPTRTTPTPTRPPEPSDQQVVTRDKFYFTGLHGGVGCREPKIAPTSGRAAANYHGLIIRGCLDRAFYRQLKAAGDPAKGPALIYWSGSVSTPCSGGNPQVSFFCSTNDTVYILIDEPLELWREWGKAGSRGRIAARMRMMHVAAHEYGHHLQHASGILEAAHDLEYDANSRETALEWSRRVELQASCFGAVFVSANSRTLPVTGAVKRGWDWVTDTGDRPSGPRDHGSRKNHNYWTKRGWNSRNLAFCNTFTASPTLVR